MVGDHDSHQPCRRAQHGPILGAVTFAQIIGGFRERSAQASPEMIEHVRRAVDDYVARLGEVEDDAATVVELVKRGDSWHISIRAGGLYCENAEPSWEAAVACVARILGEKSGQSVDSCAEVPTVRPAEKPARFVAEVKLDGSKLFEAMREQVAYASPRRDGSVECVTVGDWALAKARAELLASLPPCRIDDPEALAKLTPARVRAYLKGKGWSSKSFPAVGSGQPQEGWFRPGASDRTFVFNRLPGWEMGKVYAELILNRIATAESRSAAAVYLDILAAEPEASGGYAP